MKKFTINCDFGGQIAPFTVYVGQPEPSHHPLHFQADWLSKERGGTVPAQVMDALSKLKDLAEKNNVSFEELCVYSLGAAQQESEGQGAESEEDASESEEQIDEIDDQETLESSGEDTDGDINDQDDFDSDDTPVDNDSGAADSSEPKKK